MKEIKGFKEALWKREKEKEKLRAKEMVGAAAAAAAQAGTAGTGEAAGGVAQIVKPRLPPLWTGQKFDR